MINLDNYYLHATGGFHGNKNSAYALIEILKTGKISTDDSIIRNYNISPKKEICLCDPRVKSPDIIPTYLSSFDHFVLYSPTILLPRSIKIYQPYFSEENGETDMLDEVRCKEDITMDKFQGIVFPINREEVKQHEISKEIKDLKIYRYCIEFLNQNYSELPKKDIFTGENVTVEMVNEKIKVYENKR